MPQAKEQLKWNVVRSPVKSHLGFLKMFSSDKGLIAGKSLLEYKNGEWSLFSPQPPISGYHGFFAADEKNIWLATPDNYNSSEFYHYDGKKWRKIESPMANQITCLFFAKNGSAFLGGDREIASGMNGKWEFLSFPFNDAAQSIFAVKDILWVHLNSQKIFSFEAGKWTQHLKDKNIRLLTFPDDSHGFALAGNELLEYENNRWRIHSTSHHLKNIANISILQNGVIWGCGLNGLITCYDKNKWNIVQSPIDENLYNIQMLSNVEGWITGSKGVILKYGAPSKDNINHTLGFEGTKIVSSGADLDDEYGVVFADFNNDGLQDVYTVCIFGPNRIYINNSTSQKKSSLRTVLFSEEAIYRKISGIGGERSYTLSTEIDLGAGAADIDNDNDKDLFLCNLAGKNKLFLNDGNGYFRNVSEQSGRAGEKSERTNSVIFADVENDGDADLFITNEYSTNRLYLNNGNGYFSEVTAEAGLSTSGGSMSASFADLDNDNDPDLYITNWSKQNLLYRNDSRNGKIRFTDVTTLSGTGGENFAKSNGLAFADIDNDSDLDLFVGNRKASNRLYLNEGKLRFRDVTGEFIGIDSMLTYGVTFADFDLDGYQDLYITNIGKNILYKNSGGKKFIPITIQADASQNGYSTGSAAGDIDNDGDIDLYAANYTGGTGNLFINNINSDNYISVTLKGTKSCRDAIGAKIKLYDEATLAGYQEIICGSGYSSQNSLTAVFGALNSKVYKLEIYFPASGITRIVKNIRAPEQLIISEEEGFSAFASLSEKAVTRLVIDPEIRSGFIKSIGIFILLGVSFLYGSRKYKWTWRTASAYYIFILLLFFAQLYIFFDENYFMSTILPIVSVIVSISTIHLLYERVFLVRKTKIEKQATRDAIARDLHDDLASTLSSSVIYTEALKRSLPENVTEQNMLLNKINSLLNEASDSITDIVWTVSPQHDTLDDLLLRLRFLITDMCRTKEIEFFIEDNLDEKEFIIPDDLRRNIFLIFKEALHNVIKHSKATAVKFRFEYNKPILEIVLEDNGIGFDYGSNGNRNTLQGHGLKNLVKRAQEIKGDIEIKSELNRGTRIALRKKMT